ASHHPLPTEFRDTMHPAIKFWIPLLILLAASIFVAFRYADPSPPATLTLATGSPGGAYHATGQRYREEFARHGIDLKLRTTAGSAENLQLLENGEVDLAFLQGRVVPQRPTKEETEIRSLGSAASEPLWVFYRGDEI